VVQPSFASLYHALYWIPLILVAMKKVFLLLMIACFSVVASAQKVYFIYLQTEDQAPFYVRMNDKVFSSVASGFLILPNLTDSVYNLNLGFANSTEPEAKFSVAIRQNDKGYIIKKFDNDLALFDFGDLSIVKANTVPKDNTVYETKSDPFSNVLSKAAGDPSIVKVPVVKKEEAPKEKSEQKAEVTAKEDVAVKTEDTKLGEKQASEVNKSTQPDTIAAAIPKTEQTVAVAEGNTDSLAKADTVAAKESPKETPAVQQPAVSKEESPAPEILYKPSVISRQAESSTTEGFGLVYLDKKADGTDTIRILIPASKLNPFKETETPATETTVKPEKSAPVEEAVKTNTAENVPTKNNTIKNPQSKSGCSQTASEKDFMKLRKKMAAKENDDEMIDEARKDFRNKCYSVEQIRYLSTLFLTSAAKYQFFDVAYQHVSDGSNFASLQSEIKDDYYLKRFKALIGE
jgi:hypothetical protein